MNGEEYRDYYKRFNKAWAVLKTMSYEETSVYSTICEMRNYEMERMYDVLKEEEFVYIDEQNFDAEQLRVYDRGDLGLFTLTGQFLLSGRFIFPVRDMLGNILALIGWYPDDRKYITTPSKLFSKDCLFFGLDQLKKTGINKRYVLTEGIFDSLSVRSLGIPCVAQMGIVTSPYKQAMYSMFKQIVAIPDGDEAGRKVLKYDTWKLPLNGKYFKWTIYDKHLHIKDIDDLIKTFGEDDMKDILKSVFKEQDRVVNLDIDA